MEKFDLGLIFVVPSMIIIGLLVLIYVLFSVKLNVGIFIVLLPVIFYVVGMILMGLGYLDSNRDVKEINKFIDELILMNDIINK